MRDISEYFTVKRAAVAIGIEYAALHQRIHRGKVDVERVGERIILIHKDEVERLKKEQAA